MNLLAIRLIITFFSTVLMSSPLFFFREKNLNAIHFKNIALELDRSKQKILESENQILKSLSL